MARRVADSDGDDDAPDPDEPVPSARVRPARGNAHRGYMDTSSDSDTPQMTKKAKGKLTNGNGVPKQAPTQAEESDTDEQPAAKASRKRKATTSKVTRSSPDAKRKKAASSPAPQTRDEEEEVEEEPDEAFFLADAQESHYLNERGDDGYVVGSIMRIKCVNFMTYEHVEFSPGPHLNMIIGPNGTGKSSIANAIALGLGWPPKILGRADEVRLFVKQGYDEGHIEIELKGRKSRNVIIRREINRIRNNSDWYLDGKKAKHTDVVAKVAGLNVQVDNLCSYLPQDKVVSFAQMKPAELLKETQNAAGSLKLTSWHEYLIKMKKLLINREKKLDAEKEDLRNNEARNAALEREVARYRERRELLEEITILDTLIPYAEYKVKKLAYDEVKGEKNERVQQLRELEVKRAPYAHQKTLLEQRYKAASRSARDADGLHLSAEAKLNRINKELDASDKKLEVERNNLQSLRADIKAREQRIAQCRRQIDNIKRQLQDEPPEVDLTESKRRRRECKSEMLRLTQKIRAEQAEAEALLATTAELEAEIKLQKAQITKLESAGNRRLGALKSSMARQNHLFQGILATQAYLKEHPDKLKGKVWGPVAIEIGLTDEKAAAAMETLIQVDVFRTFVCELREDYELLQAQIANGLWKDTKYKIYLANISDEQFHAPFSLAELQRLGFDCWAIDCISGPPEVLRFVCARSNLHRIPIAFKPSTSIDVKAFESRASQVRKYVIGPSVTTIKPSMYGQGFAQTNTRGLRNATVLSSAIDATAVKECERRIATAEQQRDAQQEAFEAFSVRNAETREEHAELQSTDARLADEEQKSGAARHEWLKLKVKYEERCATLESELNKPSGEEKREKHTLALRKTARSHLSIASKAMATFHELCETRALITLRGLALQSAEADKSALDTVLAESQQAILEAQEAIEEVKARLNKCKMEASAVYQKASAKMDELPPEMSERVTERNAMGTPAEQLMIERETRQGELELLANVGSDVLRQYEERQEFIEVLRAKVVADDAALEKLRTSVQKVRHLYTPAIEALVRRVSERFGEAFNRFGCLGEINLNSESEDYDQWGIEISVSFRKQEALSLLTATRQSGGERSLSTILYLMSLTELAKAPFSLVDEINQGMDQRAERRVHNQLVAVTCTQDAGQYFLITPKLLPNLEYHQMMKILCVHSGDWLPSRFNAMEILTRRLQAVAHAR